MNFADICRRQQIVKEVSRPSLLHATMSKRPGKLENSIEALTLNEIRALYDDKNPFGKPFFSNDVTSSFRIRACHNRKEHGSANAHASRKNHRPTSWQS